MLGAPTKAAHSSSPAALLASVPAPESGCLRPSGRSVLVPVCSTCSLASRAARTAVQPPCLLACLPSLKSRESSLGLCTRQGICPRLCKMQVMVSMDMHVTWLRAVSPVRVRTWFCTSEWRAPAQCSWPGSDTLAAHLLHVAHKPNLYTATERPPSRACHKPRTLSYAESTIPLFSHTHRVTQLESEARQARTSNPGLTAAGCQACLASLEHPRDHRAPCRSKRAYMSSAAAVGAVLGATSASAA